MVARLAFAIALAGAAATAAAEPSVTLEGDVGFSDLDLDRALALRGAGIEISARVFRASDDVLVIEVGEHRRTLDMLGRSGPAAARVVAINLIDLAARRRTRPVPLMYGEAIGERPPTRVPLYGADVERASAVARTPGRAGEMGVSTGVGLDARRMGFRLNIAAHLSGPAFASLSFGLDFKDELAELPVRLGFGARTRRLGLDTGAVLIVGDTMCTRGGLESNVWWWLFSHDLSFGPEVGTRVTTGCAGDAIATEGWLGLRFGWGRGRR